MSGSSRVSTRSLELVPHLDPCGNLSLATTERCRNGVLVQASEVKRMVSVEMGVGISRTVKMTLSTSQQ